ncbi:hypothetical protein KKB06_00800, partial [Patescibacteria group bacterium]|nr:hypothetical protein [Patescibacteria group bacterium]
TPRDFGEKAADFWKKLRGIADVGVVEFEKAREQFLIIGKDYGPGTVEYETAIIPLEAWHQQLAESGYNKTQVDINNDLQKKIQELERFSYESKMEQDKLRVLQSDDPVKLAQEIIDQRQLNLDQKSKITESLEGNQPDWVMEKMRLDLVRENAGVNEMTEWMNSLKPGDAEVMAKELGKVQSRLSVLNSDIYVGKQKATLFGLQLEEAGKRRLFASQEKAAQKVENKLTVEQKLRLGVAINEPVKGVRKAVGDFLLGSAEGIKWKTISKVFGEWDFVVNNSRTLDSLSQKTVEGQVGVRSEFKDFILIDPKTGNRLAEIEGIYKTNFNNPDIAEKFMTMDELLNGVSRLSEEHGDGTFQVGFKDSANPGETIRLDLWLENGKIYFDQTTAKNLANSKIRLPEVFLTKSEVVSENLTRAENKRLGEIEGLIADFEIKLFGDWDSGEAGILAKKGALRGIEAGEKNQYKLLIDVVLGTDPKTIGTLIEALTGLGKSKVVIPEIAYLKAKVTGQDVMSLMNGSGQLKGFIESYVDWSKILVDGEEFTSLKDLSLKQIRDIEGQLTEFFDDKVVVFDGQARDGHTDGSRVREISEAKHIFTTKEIIFESLKHNDPVSEALMNKTGVLLADEGQLSLDMAIDYIMSQGQQVVLADNAGTRVFVDIFEKLIGVEDSR